MPDPDYHLNVELEEAARSKLAEPKRGLNKAALIVLLALVSSTTARNALLASTSVNA